jgi:hypothetical protein
MSGIIGNNIVRDRLVLNLDAGDAKSYSGSGSIWYDRSGNGYNATLYNSPAYSAGYLQFRSSTTNSKYATCTFDEGILRYQNQAGQWTIEAIFKYISAPTSNEAVIAGRQGCHGGIYLWTDPSIYQAIKTDQCWTGAVNTYVNSVVVNGIYHSTMTYNNGTVRHYLNGYKAVNDSTLNLASYNMQSYNTTFFIGGIPLSNPELYATNTDIAIVRCYKKQLSDAEVLQNFNATRKKFNI